MNQPKIIVIAGPNGAGKTTFAREFLLREGDCRVFLNADLIAAGLAPFDLCFRDTMHPPPIVREPEPAYTGLPPDATEWVKGAYAALVRAGQRAREIARQTGTKVVIYEDGQVLELDPDDERLLP